MYWSFSNRDADIEVLNVKNLFFTLIHIANLIIWNSSEVCDNILTQTVSVITIILSQNLLIFILSHQLYSIQKTVLSRL